MAFLLTIMEFNSIETIKKCVTSGLGITILPEIAVRHELQVGELVPLPWQDDCEVGVLMIWQKGRWLPQALKVFMEMVRSAARQKTFNC